MNLFEAIEKRRSYRRFKDTPLPDSAVQKALEMSILAPNSSNTQTWDFHWVKNQNLKEQVAKACLSQSAARTASHLIVITANASKWRRSQKALIKWAHESKAHSSVISYYEKLIPFVYTVGFFSVFAPLKYLLATAVGLFRPMMREPFTNGQIQQVAVKSAALAAENFVLAITAQGGATCMMEGFDSWRLKRALRLRFSDTVVMVIAVGYGDEKGLWGPQFRIPKNEVIHVYE